LKFKDLFFSRKNYFSVCTEEDSGDYFLSIPVSNRLVDYEEYYRIPENLYIKHKSDLNQLSSVADEGLTERDLLRHPK